jgi:hypothetical protein
MPSNSRKLLDRTNGVPIIFIIFGILLSFGAFFTVAWAFVPIGIMIIGLGILMHIGILCARELIILNEGLERKREQARKE